MVPYDDFRLTPHGETLTFQRFRQYPETGMESLTMARSKTAKTALTANNAVDTTAEAILAILRGMSPEQQSALMAQIAKPVAPAPMAPVAVAPVAVAPVAAVTLPTAITRDIGAGNLQADLLCIGVSSVRWSYGRPQRIVNFIHEFDNTAFVAYMVGEESKFCTGKRYNITCTLPGKMSKEYHGVSSNVMKIGAFVKI